MKITKRQLRRIIKEEKVKLQEGNKLISSFGFGSNAQRAESVAESSWTSSASPSHSDASDHLEDMMDLMNSLMMKYVDSGWLAAPEQDNGSLAKNIEDLYVQLNSLNNAFNGLASYDEGLGPQPIIGESYMKQRFTEMSDVVLSIITEVPGINGMDLVAAVSEDEGGWGEMPVNKEEVFTILDIMQEEGDVFFDVQEDAWYITGSPEALAAMRAY
jgi:hypothetical protein